MQHDDLDREKEICDAILPFAITGVWGLANQPLGRHFIATARTAWPARIEECRRLREREAALLAALNSLLSLAACDPQMGGGQWHWRPARGERVHEAIVAARRVLESKR